MINLQRPNLKSLTFLLRRRKINIRIFSSTASKYMESDMMKKINTMLEKSKAFEKQVKTSSDIIQEKNKMSELKKEEWNKLTEFAQKYIPYLNKEDKIKAEGLFEQGERMDILIKEKLAKMDLSKSGDIEKTLKLVDMSYDNKYKIFTKVIDIFKSNITKRISDGTISKVEVDVFNILLAKRNKEKETFLNEKTSSFNKIYEKLNGSKKISDGIPKTEPMVKEISSSTRENDASSLFEDNIPSEAPLSDEFLNIVKEVLDLFS